MRRHILLKISSCFVVLLFSTHVHGQDIKFKGDVKTQAEGTAVSYASIGIKGKAFGTIADSLENLFYWQTDRRLTIRIP